MTKKLSQEYVANEFSSRGCQLLGEYCGKDKPVEYICKCGRKSTITYSSFRRGSYCVDCGGKRQLTNEEITQSARSRGCELLSEYKSAHEKITIKCRCGTVYETTWNSFYRGKNCINCGRIKAAKSNSFSQKEAEAIFTNLGCKLIGQYKSSHEKVKCVCICGREAEIRLSHLQNGVRCKQCRTDGISGPNNSGWIADRAEAALRRSLTGRCHAHLRCIYQNIGGKKTAKSKILVGYSQAELRNHLKNHSNWNSVKNDKWHIDHIFPIKAFMDYKIHDIALINCLDNLRPIIGVENMRKNSRYNKLGFETWLSSKNITFVSKIQLLT
jgi:hypothetical protein